MKSDRGAPKLNQRLWNSAPVSLDASRPEAPAIKPHQRSAPERPAAAPQVTAPVIQLPHWTEGNAEDIREAAPASPPPARSAQPTPGTGGPGAPKIGKPMVGRSEIPTIPQALLANTPRDDRGLFVSFDLLVEGAIGRPGLKAHGLLGSLRLLRAKEARKYHAQYALSTLLANVDALLPDSWRQVTSMGHAQNALDAFGCYAEQLAACRSFADVARIDPVAESVAGHLQRLADHVALLDPNDPDFPVFTGRMLLDFKEAVEKRLMTVLRSEEQLGARRFAELKSLTPFAAGLAALSAAVIADRQFVRHHSIREEAQKAAHLAPRAQPKAPSTWLGQAPAAAANPQVLAACLDKLRNAAPITVAERTDFLEQVFLLPQNTSEAAVIKAGHLQALGSAYVEKKTAKALREAVRCFDQALVILSAIAPEPPDAQQHAVLRRCYEQRGQAFMHRAAQLAATLGPQRGVRLVRAKRHEAFRDFAAALALAERPELCHATNYVAASAQSLSLSPQDAHAKLTQICALNDDFADAHFQLFWRSLEVSELDTAQRWDEDARLFQFTSGAELQTKLSAVESAVSAFVSADLTALYQQRLADGKAPAARAVARDRMGVAALEHLTRLHRVATLLCRQAGGEEQHGRALLHLCQAVEHTREQGNALRLELKTQTGAAKEKALQRNLRQLQQRTFNLMLQKAVVYGQLKLRNCQTEELEAMLRLAQRLGWRAKLPQLRMWLGKAYLKQDKGASAQAQFQAIAAAPRVKDAIKRDAAAALKKLDDRPQVDAPAPADDAPATLLELHDDIIAGCWQVLADSERACGDLQGLIWKDFVQSLFAAKDVKAWSEIIIARLHVSKQLTPERLMGLLRLANQQTSYSDPVKLLELQNCVTDATRTFVAAREVEQDGWIRARDVAQVKLEQSDAFFNACQSLSEALRDGARVRPGSVGYNQIKALSLALAHASDDSTDDVIDRLRELCGELNGQVVHFIKANRAFACEELSLIAQAVLASEVECVVDGHVLTVSGRTVFFSQFQQRLDATLASNPGVREVRVVAENLYIDADVTLRGKNLLLGAQCLEWMTAEGPGGPKPITIDLSGRDNTAEPPKHIQAKAASGPPPYGTDGESGAAGGDGDPGESGGDLVLHCAGPCVGFDAEHLAAIKLSGGKGAPGGDGQHGGDARRGAPGVDGAPKDAVPLGFGAGYHTLYPGTPGGHAGQAGMGGSKGLGGDGGISGQLMIRGVAAQSVLEAKRSALVQGGSGGHGDDGHPGEGGKGAPGGPDGKDLLMANTGWFADHKQRRGYGLHYPHRGGDRDDADRWRDRFTNAEQTMAQRASHDRTGDYKARESETRRAATKHGAEVAAFGELVENNLAQTSSANRRDAFADVTGARVSAQDADAAWAAAGQEFDALIDEAKALHASTVEMLTQHQRSVASQTQYNVMSEARTAQPEARVLVIGYDDAPPPHVPGAPLQMADTPALHPRGQKLTPQAIDVAMDDVNTTLGQDPVALGALMQAFAAHLAQIGAPAPAPASGVLGRIKKFGRGAAAVAALPRQQQMQTLLRRLAELTAAVPLESLVAHGVKVEKGLAALDAAAAPHATLRASLVPLRQAVNERISLADRARALFEQSSEVVNNRIAGARTDLRIRCALRRLFASDRLVRRVLASDAGLPLRKPQHPDQAAWLAQRMQQKVVRLLGKRAQDGRVVERHGAWVAKCIEALRDAALHATASSAEEVAGIVKQFSDQMGTDLENQRACLTEHERHICRGLMPVCAALASRKEELPKGFEAMTLQGIVSWIPNAAEDYVPQAREKEAEAPAEEARPSQSIETVLDSLTVLLGGPASAQDMRTLMERHIEGLRAAGGGTEHLPLARITSVFTQALKAPLSSGLQPLLSEVATALLVCPDTHVSNLFVAVGGSLPCTVDERLRLVLEALISGVSPQETRRALARHAPDTVDAETQPLMRLHCASDLLLMARIVEDTTQALVKRTTPHGASTAQALEKWLPTVQRWLAWERLLPDVDVPSITRAPLPPDSPAETAVHRAMQRAALPLEPHHADKLLEPEALLAVLTRETQGKQGLALTAAAKGALYLLLTSDRPHAVTSAAHRWAGSMRADKVPDADILALAEADFSATLFEAQSELLDAWAEARDTALHKIALAGNQEALRTRIPVQSIERSLAFIDQLSPSLDEEAQATYLEQATQAAGGRLSDLESALARIKHDLLTHVAQANPSDGWDSERAHAYNTALGRAKEDAPAVAGAFVQLLSALPIPLPKDADLSRLGLAIAVAAQQFEFSQEQQVELYTRLHALRDVVPGATRCLSTLQHRWLDQAQQIAGQHAERTDTAQSKVLEAQTTFAREMADLLTSGDVPDAATRMAQADLLMALLDRHHARVHGDVDGAQRCQAYKDISFRAASVVAAAPNPSQASQALGLYLTQAVREHLAPGAQDSLLTVLTTAISRVTLNSDGSSLDPAAVKVAIDDISALAWRGVLPFFAEGADSALARLDEHVNALAPDLLSADNVDAGYADLARCLQTKFADHLLRDDAFAARDAALAATRSDEAMRDAALSSVRQWLSAEILEPSQLHAVAELTAGLQAVFANPTEAMPPLPTMSAAAPADSALATNLDALDTQIAQAIQQAKGPALSADLLQACETYADRCKKADPKASLPPDHAVRLSSMQALLGAPTLNSQLKARQEALSKEIESLQAALVELEVKAAAARRTSIATAVRRALVSLSAEHPILTHLDKLLARNNEAAVNAFMQAHPGAQNAHVVSNIVSIKSAMETAAACWGDESFAFMAARIHAALEERKTPLAAHTVAQLWLAVSDCTDFDAIEGVITTSFAESWATGLRALQCREAMREALGEALNREHAAPKTQSAEEIETYCDSVVTRWHDAFAEATQAWDSWLSGVQQNPDLRPDQRACLLGIVSRKLTRFAVTGTPFPREVFKTFTQDLIDPAVLALLAREFDKGESLIVNGLRDASFDTSQRVLRHAWIFAKMEPIIGGLSAADRNRLIVLLSGLAGARRDPIMRQVVQAIQESGVITPNVVDAVANFADHAFEPDAEALQLLRTRSQRSDWFEAIAHHTRTQRSRLRKAPDLARLMYAEAEGVNRSVASWVAPGRAKGPSKLEITLEAVQAASDRTVGDNPIKISAWTAEDVTRWANEMVTEATGGYYYANRGPQLLQNPERLHVAMAVLSRSIELTRRFRPRDTQLATMCLMVSDPDGVSPGKLAQVATGEGKSVITAGIAILKALSGQHVDIITTSKVLAERDAAENAALYTMFGLRVSNNCDDACDKGDTNRSAEAVRRERYGSLDKPVHIVYGEVSAFERDQLLTDFHPHDPDKQVINHTRGDRAKRCALVDEVDGLLLDNASMVLYLSHEVESLRHFEQLFVRLWDMVNSSNLPLDSAGNDQVVSAITQAMEHAIALGEIEIPKYPAPNAPYMQLGHMVTQRLRGWVRSALHARSLRLNQQYIVVDGRRPRVVVMDQGTGVEQTSVRWSNGLHQFLQLKHGLEIGPESLKAVFLSNLFFFQQYGKQLFGLSGTLGSEDEQQCLNSLFGVGFFKMPRNSGEKYVQRAEQVTQGRQQWIKAIGDSIDAEQTKGRATLVVCESIDDVLTLKTALSEQFPDLHVYSSSQQELPFLDHANPRPVRPRDVIIATNLAGRGTDLKTSQELEQAGGMHVILSYLPANLRIQEQAFGRTARSGNEGTGQFIVCDPARRPIFELCRLRDIAEGQRLEKVLQRDRRRIEFEHKLLMGFNHRGKEFGGFASLLREVDSQVRGKGHPDYYVAAQIDSLKNRWAFWLDSINAQMDLIHVTGPHAMLDAYERFEAGVRADLASGWEGLIVEPAEWMKLGRAFREAESWHRAEQCYEIAARDEAYAVAKYYKVACQLMRTPSREASARKEFRVDSKAAARSAQGKLEIFQDSAQIIARLSAQRRAQGDADFGSPFAERASEKMQIWQIFISAINGALGETLRPEELDERSSYIRDAKHANEVFDTLVEGGVAKPRRVSNKFELQGETFTQAGKEIGGTRRFAPAADALRSVLQRKQAISHEAVIKATKGLMTHEAASAALAKHAVIKPRLRLKELPTPWPGWEGTAFSGATRAALVARYEAMRLEDKAYETPEAFEEAFKDDAPIATVQAEAHAFIESLQSHKVLQADSWLDFGQLLGKHPHVYPDDKQVRGAVAKLFVGFDPSLVTALSDALRVRHASKPNGGNTLAALRPTFGIKPGIYLGELALFESADAAAKNLWTILQNAGVVKAPKVYWPAGRDLKAQTEAIKQLLRTKCDLPSDEIEDAVNSVFAVLESTFGMMRSLDDAKITVRFAEIARAHFLDHARDVPPALREFVEAGLDVVASLIEKKDPPAWYETAALIVGGTAQIVAGILIKEYLPVVGELIGNSLISTGLDDIVFGVSSAISGEFSWNDYWEAKQSSMLNAVIASAIGSAASFAASSVSAGAGEAWNMAKLSNMDKLEMAAKSLGNTGFNIATHIGEQFGRTMLSAGISQVASRGIQSVVGDISNIYAAGVESAVTDAVRGQWPGVREQMRALHDKLKGDSKVKDLFLERMRAVLRRASQEQVFTSIMRMSKPAIGTAASSLASGGLQTLISAGGDLANLGVSVTRMATLVNTEVAALAREVRKVRDIKAAPTTEVADPLSEEALASFLNAQEAEFSRGLTSVINGLLSSSVYSPLVSYSTQFATDRLLAELMPHSEVEALAASDEFVSKARKIKENNGKAYYDEALRSGRGADMQVDLNALSPDEMLDLLRQPVEGAGKTVAQLQSEYQGCELKVFRDAENRIYVQRPDYAEYTRAVLTVKPAGEPEMVAAAKKHGTICLTDRSTGEVNTYYADGTIDNVRPERAIVLDYTPGQSGQLGHITATGASVTEDSGKADCFYAALVAAQPALGMTVTQARKGVASRMVKDPSCKTHYHNWSLDGQVKEFAGFWGSSKRVPEVGVCMPEGYVTAPITDLSQERWETPQEYTVRVNDLPVESVMSPIDYAIMGGAAYAGRAVLVEAGAAAIDGGAVAVARAAAMYKAAKRLLGPNPKKLYDAGLKSQRGRPTVRRRPEYIPRDEHGKPVKLPQAKNGEPVSSSDYPHSQIGYKKGARGNYHKTREFGYGGRPRKTVDWTDHGRPKDHTNPHVHDVKPNPTGGTPKRDDGRPPRPGEF